MAKAVDIYNDPEYVEVYSLPIGMAKLFRNCAYLEYPAMGRFPEEPVKGYVSSGADLGDLCCPCWCNSKVRMAGEEDAEDGKRGTK